MKSLKPRIEHLSAFVSHVNRKKCTFTIASGIRGGRSRRGEDAVPFLEA